MSSVTGCSNPCEVSCPQPQAVTANEPCVITCPDSRVIIYPPPVVVTFPGPILTTCPQESVVPGGSHKAVLREGAEGGSREGHNRRGRLDHHSGVGALPDARLVVAVSDGLWDSHPAGAGADARAQSWRASHPFLVGGV
uniref:Keratin n=1 Tax=Crocodylus porosus TaxID=8502 RepID=A0A7M4G000_CROPO